MTFHHLSGNLEIAFNGVCEEISVNNQIFYDNELAEGLF